MNIVSIPVTIDELAALWKMRHGEVVAAIPNVTPPATNTAVLPVALITGKCQYKILGEHRSAKTSVAAYLDILTTLSSVEPDLPERLSLVTPASSRNHIARSRDGVYPLRPDLGRKAREFAPGWYAGRNIADREKRRILQRACGILGLQFGKDVAF